MQYSILLYTILSSVVHSAFFVSPLEISSKLDFSDTNTKSKLVRSEVSVAPKLVDKNGDEFQTIGIVCTNGSCNKTNSDASNNTNKDTLKADVIVHIETNIDHGKTNGTATAVEDVPDIPVVVGYEGVDTDSLEDNPDTRPGAVNAFDSDKNPPSMVSTTYIQDLTPKALFKPSVFNAVRPKENGIEVQVPYFEPAYNSHYYGENPAPQLLWYPKTANYNPVEFKNTLNRRTWTSATAPQRGYHSFRTQTEQVGCICHNSRSQKHPSWYTKPTVQQPGSQINDKLAPLN